jgi:hypothetical protein
MTCRHAVARPLLLLLLLLALVAPGVGTAAADVGPCPVFPPDHIFNTRVDSLPVHPNSDAYINSIGRTRGLHADFGSGLFDGGPIGIPFITVPGSQPLMPINFVAYGDESDPGPYPIPPGAPIEGGDASDGDRHVLTIETGNCVLYELYRAFPVNGGASWDADSGAVYDLQGYALRTDGFTSADAAGFPIFPLLVRRDEAVLPGGIQHAIRFTASRTRREHVWPARHDAGSTDDPNVPPMGQYFRLKATKDVTFGGTAPAHIQAIFQAMKTYGVALADNGSNWFFSGVPDGGWENDELNGFFGQVHGDDFEAVDVPSLMVDPDSGRVTVPGPPGPALSLVIRGTDNAIRHKRYDGALWGIFQSLPGATADIPALASSGGGILDLVVRGIDNSVYHNHFNGTAWSGWVQLPGATADIPALVASGGGALDLVVRGTDNGVYWNHYNGTTWSGWTPLPGATSSIPALASSGGGILDLVVRGIDNGVYWNHYNGTTWSGWTPLPGATSDIPALAASGGGILDLVVRGTDNGVYWNHYNGTTWSGWTPLPGATSDIPALAASGGGVLDLVVRGVDNGIYWNHYDGTSWSGWTALPGATISIPALVASGGGTLDLAVRGTDNRVYTNHYTGSAWTGWLAVGGPTASRPALALE